MTSSEEKFRTIGRSGKWQVRNIEDASDGDQRHWPAKPYRPGSREHYLITLGKAWAEQDKLDKAAPDVNFYLNKLPDGYDMFETDQPGSRNVYKRLFGHPSGKFFDSAPRFQPHFLWLMSRMKGDCECVLCWKGKPKIAPIPRKKRLIPELSSFALGRRNMQDEASGSSSRSESLASRLGGIGNRPQRQIKAAGAPYAVDENGNEDVYKELIKRLYTSRDSKKGIEDDILEHNHMDWRATHEHQGLGAAVVENHLTSMELQHSFIPRIGELVLWIPQFLHQHSLMIDENSEYKFYSFDQKCFHGHPSWRAGVVAQVPSAKAQNGLIDFPDIQGLPEKKTTLNTSGFLIETFPDPNDEMDKSASKQSRYVALRDIRPLSHWRMLLRGIPRERWHPSIKNALTCMTSMSLLEKFWFSGQWPNAHIRCKGLFLGPELIIVGDAVRIRPEGPRNGTKSTCTDVLVVEQIRFNLVDIKEYFTYPDSEHLASSYTITLKGKGYTLDENRSYDAQLTDSSDLRIVPSQVPLYEVKTTFKAVGAADYGNWYYLHDPMKRYEISHDMVFGRLYEAGAVQLWTGQIQTKEAINAHLVPSLGFDVMGIETGRQFGTQSDQRLEQVPDGAICWYLGDHRADALDLEFFNGNKIGRYEAVRDKATQEQWRNHVKVLNGLPVTEDQFKYTSFAHFTIPGTRGRKPGSRVVDGRVIYPGQPGYDVAVATEHTATPRTPKPKGYSQLAAAAVVSADGEDTDEGDDEDEGEEDDKGTERFYTAEAEDSGSAEVPRVPLFKSKPKAPATKAQIMSGIEDMDLEDDFTSEEEYWPVARGGTEESDGGDYRPNVDTQ
ncbi:hypothetical protein LTR84_006611 [Exophiala bonariae]|uniref:Cryptic loci regulator 2 N-terminal domain-containing protein n=1 Tax=Exophiala bonariae TaxID=1690606 RepID=A0AAV9N0S9_9EURO|nr:hypothetical protein LTR84_006611 [Exophiala bonariae]